MIFKTFLKPNTEQRQTSMLKIDLIVICRLFTYLHRNHTIMNKKKMFIDLDYNKKNRKLKNLLFYMKW